jgi:hypothetical protein
MKLRHLFTLFAASVLTATPLSAQVAPAKPAPSPVPYSSANELNGLLAQLDQAAQSTQGDLARLRIDKWKMDSTYKQQTENNVESIRRNLRFALPEIMGQLRAAPEDLAATFKLYRNLDALFDVLGNVTESAGAFGPRDDFQALNNNLNSFERVRHALADRMERLATTKENEIGALRTQVKTLQAQIPPPPPKKIIVDDDEPKKPSPKKKSSSKKTSHTQPAPSTPPPQ